MNKHIKILVIAILALVNFKTGNSQKTEQLTVKLSAPSKAGKLDVDIFNGSVKVISYPGKEVLVTATGPYYPNNIPSTKDKDQVKDPSSKSSNVDISEKNNIVTIKVEKPRIMNLVIKVPQNFSVVVKVLTAGDIVVENVSGDHEVSIVNGNITMSGIIGSVLANTKYGGITVDINPGKKNTPSAFSNVMGIIDVSFPGDLKANASLQTEFGEVHSDFAIVKDPSASTNTDNEKKRAIGKINGGGPDIMLRSVGGNVYLRKKK
ncbi:MAG: hypothetical protein WDN26_19825 [Chitinophagaceae bacterium]